MISSLAEFHRARDESISNADMLSRGAMCVNDNEMSEWSTALDALRAEGSQVRALWIGSVSSAQVMQLADSQLEVCVLEHWTENLTEHPTDSDAFAETLARTPLPHLRELALYSLCLTDRGLNSLLLRCQNLQILELIAVGYLSESAFADFVRNLLVTLPLQGLRLEKMPLGDETLRSLAAYLPMSSLTSLAILVWFHPRWASLITEVWKLLYEALVATRTLRSFDVLLPCDDSIHDLIRVLDKTTLSDLGVQLFQCVNPTTPGLLLQKVFGSPQFETLRILLPDSMVDIGAIGDVLRDGLSVNESITKMMLGRYDLSGELLTGLLSGLAQNRKLTEVIIEGRFETAAILPEALVTLRGLLEHNHILTTFSFDEEAWREMGDASLVAEISDLLRRNGETTVVRQLQGQFLTAHLIGLSFREMSGDEDRSLTVEVDADMILQDLQAMILRRFESPTGRLDVILPDGTLLRKADRQRTLRDVISR